MTAADRAREIAGPCMSNCASFKDRKRCGDCCDAEAIASALLAVERETIERAAGVAENSSCRPPNPLCPCCCACEEVAAAIRALSPKETDHAE